MQKNIEKSLNIFLWLLGVFFLHRLMSFGALNQDEQLGPWSMLDAVFVGLLSDIWLAALGGLIGFLGMLVARLIWRQPSSPWPGRLVIIWPLLVVCLTTLHQSYVGFFKIQVLAAHLKYFTDFNFIQANAQTAVDPRAVIIFLSSLCGGVVMRLRWQWPLRRMVGFATFILVLALGCHSLNIRWRVQHFIQEHLQVNFFEKLYIHMKVPSTPTPLSQSQWHDLQKAFPVASLAGRVKSQLLLWSPQEQKVDGLLQRLKDRSQGLIKEGAQPLFLTVLLESARPAEFGPYGPLKNPDLTPAFSRLSQSGVLFENMYTVGSVTRSGQEAVWCGYLSSLYLSMMRERPDIQVDCLPRLGADEGFYFWWHGGKGAFDNQAVFWRQQGVAQQVTLADFAADVPRSGWGVSDVALMRRTLLELKDLKTEKKYLMGMLLSMSNHIPWPLPKDAQVHQELSAITDSHPSYATTRYTDDALNILVEGLKEQGFWEKTILVIVSDHGMADKPYRNFYENSATKDSQLKSHGVLLLSGGVVEAAIETEQERRVQSFVSQASVGAFWAYILGMKQPLYAPPLFASDTRFPVFASLEGKVYFPKYDLNVKSKNMMNADASFFDPEILPGVLYFRAYLNSLNQVAPSQ